MADQPRQPDKFLVTLLTMVRAADMLVDITLIVGGVWYQGELISPGRYFGMMSTSLSGGAVSEDPSLSSKFQSVLLLLAKNENHATQGEDWKPEQVHLLCTRRENGAGVTTYSPAKPIRFRLDVIDGILFGANGVS